MANKLKIVECSVRLYRCDDSLRKVGGVQSSHETDKGRVKRETEQCHDDGAAVDWIKREHNVYETEELYVEERLEIEPTVLQPYYPTLAALPKMESTSGIKQESCIEESTPGWSLDAGGSSHAGLKHTNQSLNSTRPLKAPRVRTENTSCPSKPKSCKGMLTDERPFSCTICDAKFKKPYDMRRHMRIHTGERPFSCTVCDAKFTQSSRLKVHLRSHTGERPFSCTVCDAKFTQSSGLKVHLRSHTGERPFSCTICNAKFKESGNLKKHMRIHTGERPFHCTICDAKFTQSSNLKKHVLVHTTERPFDCTICEAKFKESDYLKKHMRKHTGEQPFNCAICDEKFIRSDYLKRHMRIHTGERPFSCTVCDAKFKQFKKPLAKTYC